MGFHPSNRLRANNDTVQTAMTRKRRRRRKKRERRKNKKRTQRRRRPIVGKRRRDRELASLIARVLLLTATYCQSGSTV